MIDGFHYSSQAIPVGVSLISRQAFTARWKFILPIYQKVASERGLVIPEVFAYCYPKLVEHLNFPHLVRATADSAVLGNCDYSPLVAIECRLKKDSDIEDFANRYLDVDLDRDVELIGQWTVVEIIT
jgi:hypothetical protein